MEVGSSLVSPRGMLRLLLVAAFMLVGTIATPLGARAVGDVVIVDPSVPDVGLSIGDTVYVTSDSLNVRSGPGTGYTIIDVMSYGQNGLIIDGPVYADGYTWFELTYVAGVSDGWVAGEFLGLVSTGGGLTIGDTVAVVADGLNVRSGPGLGYTIIDVMVYGQNGLIIDGPVSADGYTWYQLNYVGGTSDGWVAGDYLELVATGGLSIGDTVAVVTDGLNVRSGPGTGYTVIDVMVYGQNGLIIDGPVYADGYTWYELTYVGGTYDGWVAGEYLALA